ncbi:hypothetical protein BKA61DRAFT_299356 [Leptodontidium sp. MPI-SDFR-AT-0119]|nr:hypothetical protein BKA61DRAFT_299356 [Leptodontidium sp. MPI-SDFR-AT-0119]
MRVQDAVLVFYTLAVTVLGEDILESFLNASSCVAPNEFDSCHAQALNKLRYTCLSMGSDRPRGDPCLCDVRAETLNYFGRYCWNYVYGCDYQKMINLLLLDCFPDPVAELESVPFWHTPVDGPATCSCNFASMEWDLTDAQLQHDTCIDTTSPGGSGCYCCSLSRIFSLPVDVCPTSDFPPIRFNKSDKNDFSGKIWSNCAHAFAEVDCLDIGFQKPPSATIYQPSNLRLPGTEPRSTLPGQISTPLSGWTYTWSLGTKEYVVTAFLPTGTVTSTPTTSAFESGTTSSQTATTIVASSGATVTGSAMPSTTSTSSGAFGRTRPLRSHGEQVLVIVIGLLLILFLVTVGMYL